MKYDPSLFRLDEEHNYWYGLLPVPGLSRLIQDYGLTDYSHVPAHILERARNRGTIVHGCVESYLRGEPYEAGQYEGYVEGAINYIEENVRKPILVEQSILDYENWTACTPDLLHEDGLVEWKTSSKIEEWHAVQLAAQADMLEASGHIQSAIDIPKVVVKLNANGIPEVSDFNFTDNENNPFDVWFSVVKRYYALNPDMRKIARQGRQYIEEAA